MDLHLTEKGQTTIPKALREHLGVGPGGTIKVVILDNGSVYMVPSASLSSLKGMFKGRVAKPVTVDEMNATVRSKAAERYRRTLKK
jgi:antitoxin PrlF